MDEPPKIRLNAQGVEVVSANLKSPRQGWILAGVQPRLSDVISDQTVEAAIAVAQIQIIGIRLTRVFIVTNCALNSIQALRLRHIQRPQDQTI